MNKAIIWWVFLITSRYNGSSSVLLRGPSPPLKKALYKVWLKLAKLNFKKGFSSDQCIFSTLLFIPLKKVWTLFGQTKFSSTRIAFTQESFVPGLVEMGTVVLERMIYTVFIVFSPIIALWKVYGPYLNKPESLSPMKSLGHVWLNLVKEIFKDTSFKVCLNYAQWLWKKTDDNHDDKDGHRKKFNQKCPITS